MERGGTVYIMTNKRKTVLYTGVTSSLMSRVMKHRNGAYPDSFSFKYNTIHLVYYKFFGTIEEAIAEEKRIKAGSRKQKIKLIEGIGMDGSLRN
jgi:putative endonuclease